MKITPYLSHSPVSGLGIGLCLIFLIEGDSGIELLATAGQIAHFGRFIYSPYCSRKFFKYRFGLANPVFFPLAGLIFAIDQLEDFQLFEQCITLVVGTSLLFCSIFKKRKVAFV
jgi:hypothetical protein